MVASPANDIRQSPLFHVNQAVSAAGYAIYELDTASGALQWLVFPEHFQRHFGFGHAKREQDFLPHIQPEDRALRLDALQMLKHHQRYTAEYRVVTAAGERRWILESGGYSRIGEPNDHSRIYATLLDITEHKQNSDRSGRLANYDDMTGVFNNFRLTEMLEHAIAYARRYKQTCAYMIIGIDRLSALNDAFGYETGDAVMVGLCRRLSRALRDSDVIGRIGGDRLGILLHRCTEHDVNMAARRLLHAVGDAPIDTASGPINVTISVGSVLVPRHAETVYDCQRRAESALRQAKKRGRDCHVCYEEVHAQVEQSSAMREKGELVRDALARNQFCLAYQPIVTAQDKTTALYECLLRIVQEDGTVIAAGQFIEVAEHLGLIRQIDHQVLDLVLADLAATKGIDFAFNISATTVGDQDWLAKLRKAVARKPAQADRLVVEITETAAMTEGDASRNFIMDIRALGCHVALDDFGAGYTSFRQLKSLPVDYMKIDGSFSRQFGTSDDNRIFVRTMLDLAKAFNLKTIAEGIEEAHQADDLVREGVDYLQGYHYGRPAINKPWLAVEKTVSD